MKNDQHFKVLIIGGGCVGLTFAILFEKAGVNYNLLVRKIPQKDLPVSMLGEKFQLPKERFILNTFLKYDLLISAVKRFDIEGVVSICNNNIKPNGSVLAIQNGINVKSEYGDAISHVKQVPIYIVSEWNDKEFNVLGFPRIDLPTDTGKPLLRLFEATDFVVSLTLDINQRIWHKMIFVSAISGVCAYHNINVGQVLKHSRYRQMFKNAVFEAVCVAQTQGVFFNPNFQTHHLKMLGSLPEKFKPSLCNDIAANQRSELNWLSGTIVKLALENNLLALTHTKIFNKIEKMKKVNVK